MKEPIKYTVQVYDTPVECDNFQDALEQIQWTVEEQCEFAIAFPTRRKDELLPTLEGLVKRLREKLAPAKETVNKKLREAGLPIQFS